MSSDKNTDTLKKVLLVDDDEYILDIYSVKFQEEEVDVKAVDNAKEALEILAEEEFDAVLLDIVMPAMSGLEMLEAIREREISGDASVIVLSNQGQPEDIEKAEKYDIDGYIVKASSVPSEVLEQVREIYDENHD